MITHKAIIEQPASRRTSIEGTASTQGANHRLPWHRFRWVFGRARRVEGPPRAKIGADSLAKDPAAHAISWRDAWGAGPTMRRVLRTAVAVFTIACAAASLVR